MKTIKISDSAYEYILSLAETARDHMQECVDDIKDGMSPREDFFRELEKMATATGKSPKDLCESLGAAVSDDPIAETVAYKSTASCCFECKYWDNFYTDESTHAGSGHCVRYAPRPKIGKDPEDGEENVIWPITRENEGCGEFQQKIS